MANKKIKLKYNGNKELIGKAELSVILNKKILSTHNIKEGFESYFSVTNSNFILELVISLRLFNFIPISRKTELKINNLENSDYELLIYYDSFNGKFSKEYELTKIDLQNQNINPSDETQFADKENYFNTEEIKKNWKKYLVYTGLIFIFFKACSGCLNSSKNKFIEQNYIGKYCEEGYSNKCIEFFEDGTFKSNNFAYGTDYLGNITYFGNGNWSYIGKQDPQYSLFSDCYMLSDYDEVDIKSSKECCKIKEEIAFYPGSYFKDGKARFTRLFTDPVSYQTIGCIDYIKVN